MSYENGLLETILLLVSYSLLGASIKYIDQAYDENHYNKKVGIVLAILSGILIGYLVGTDMNSAVILIAVVIGVAATKKIDNQAFSIGTLLILISLSVYGATIGFLKIDIGALVLLTITAIVDEVGNDAYDNKKIKGLIGKFFEQRCAMKLGILLLVIAGKIPLIYLFAFLLFDISYTLVDIESKRHTNAHM